MNRTEIFAKVVEICKDNFEDEGLMLSEATSADDVEAWDSLTHVNLISDIEEEFEISFTLDELMNAKNLGDLVGAIENHIKQGAIYSYRSACRY